MDIIKILFSKNVPVNGKNDDGKTPLMNACEEGNVEVVKQLLEKGADQNLRSKTSERPIDLNLGANNVSINGILLKYKSKNIIGSFFSCF